MKDLIEFLYKLNNLGLVLWNENGKLKYKLYQELDNEEVLFNSIRENKEALLDILLQNNVVSEEVELPLIYKVSSNNVELSFAQERLWFIEQYEQGTNAYHIPTVLECLNFLDQENFKRAIEAVVDRHEVLRSTFSQDEEGIGYQIVCDSPLSFLTYEFNKKSEFESQLHVDINAPFDLTKNYPIRVIFYKVSEAESQAKWYALINIHHIAFDGWSTNIFIKEFEEYYESFSKEKSLELSPLPIQYKDFSLWQKNYLTGEILDKQLNYWREKLKDFETLALPVDKVRPAHIDYRGNSVRFELNADLSKKLRTLAREYGCTLYTVLLSGFYVLLSKYTGQSDLVVGTPVANRDYAQLENLIGFFVNSLVLRARITSDETGIKLIKQVQESLVEGQRYQELPFEKLVELLQVEQDSSRHPIFQVIFVLENFASSQSSKNFKAYEGNVSYKTAKFDMGLFLTDKQEGILGSFNYATSLFEEETMKRWSIHYQRILHQLVQNPKKDIQSYQILTSEEKQKLIYDWNKIDKVFQAEKTIHQLFEEQVSQVPDKVALIFGDESLTYQMLNEKSNQLANYIRKQYQAKTAKTLQPDTLIVLCLERSFDMVIAILAVLKAGGAYVPIDPNYPEERIHFILDDTESAMLLTQTHLTGKLNKIAEKSCLVTLDDKPYRNESRENLEPFSKPSDLVYVIYTSGTTGHPKGVLQIHSNVIRLFSSSEKLFYFTKEDTWSLYHSYVFDFSVWELWGALFHGGQLFIPSQEQVKDIAEFYQLCIKHKISVLNQTPSAFYQFADIASQHQDLAPYHINYIIFGGEALNTQQLATWWQYSKTKNLSAQLVNMYGITETTVHVTFKKINPDESVRSNIGKPLGDLTAYIVDANFNPVPIGVIGELYIGGAGLARGYLNRPELTAERFINNPFATLADQEKGYTRLYKTGDLGRWLPNGEIEYIGRNDFQVKIRGFRIELGEIERVLSNYPSISQVCVLVKERHNQYLAAYYVSKKAIKEEVLIEYLSQYLPDYMIPSVFVHREYFPLTVNGKLDHKALPEPDFHGRQENYIAPRTPIEEQCCAIWESVLSVEKVGIEDDFFRIGGDSILSIRIASKMQRAGIFVSVRDIFTQKTIKNIIEHVSDRKKIVEEEYIKFQLVDHKTKEVVFNNTKYSSDNIEDIYPASYLQMGMLVDSQKAEDGTYHDVFCYTINAHFDEKKFLSYWQSLSHKYDSLRVCFIDDEHHGYLSILHKNIDLSKKIQCISVDIREFVSQEKLSFINSAIPGLFRLFIKPEQDCFTLIFSFHHAITDGWSVASLISEFAQMYTQNSQIKDEVIPPYAKFVSKELTALQDEHSKSFWKNYLSNYTASSNDLILEKTDSNNEEQVIVHHRLDSSISEKLLERVKQLRVSPDNAFLALYALALSKFLNQEDLLVGLVVNNRLEEEGGDKVFGLHLNTIPMRFNITSESYDNLDAYITNTFNEKLKINEFKLYPYARIKSDLQYQTDIYQCSFNYIHFHIAEDAREKGVMTNLGGFEKTNMPLVLSVSRALNRFTLSLIGHSNFIDENTATRMLKYMEYFLSQLVEFSTDKFLPEYNYHQIVNYHKETDNNFKNDKTLIQLFQEQVNRAPNNVALIFEGKEVTYNTLNERSNQLAHYITKQYEAKTNELLRPDTLIALCLDRSIDMVIAILGILKAGGAYVPIDPTYPDQRIHYLLDDTQSDIVLTQSYLKKRLENITKKPSLISLDEIDFEENNKECYSSVNKVSDLAYVIYTSGSTGKPKGTMVEHGSIVNLVKQSNFISITEEDVLAQMANMSFDAMTFEIWGALLNGAKLLILTKDEFTNFSTLSDRLSKYKVTTLFVTTALFNLMVERDKQMLLQLKTVLFGGENVHKQSVFNLLQAKETGSHFRLLHVYGPTECTTYSSFHELIAYNDMQKSIPIGKALSRGRLYVLDKALNSSLMGVPGELYIGGAGVARGYLNQPELTAERFIINPFQSEEEKTLGQNARLYKTGDLVRWLPDGSLEFIERIDNQVKIRGFRIELGEVEAALSEHVEIQQSIVIVQGEESNKQLIAYYVPKNKSIEKKLLREYMLKKLPDYMLPNNFVEMAAFPLTENGKLDRKALPSPESNEEGGSYLSPRTEIENILCVIWASLLNITQVGITDDFFRLGGNSILAINLAYKMSKALDKQVTVADLFRYKTIQQIIYAINDNDHQTVLIPHVMESKTVLSFAQQRLWFIDQYEEGTNAYHIPMVLKCREGLKKEYIEQALLAIVHRHEVLRTTFVQDKYGVGYQVVNNAPLSIMSYDFDSVEKFDLQLKKDINLLFNLTEDYPIRVVFYNLVEETSKSKLYLLINIHHIAFDGWSINIFTKELEAYYDHFSQSKPLQLPKLSVQYKDFSVWQKNYINDEIRNQKTQYWQEKLKNFETLMLPTDKARPAKMNYQGNGIHFTLDINLSNELKSLAKKHACTLYTILLSGFYILLNKYTGQSDLIIGTPTANRGYAQLEHLIGFFVNNLVLRAQITVDETGESLIKQVKETLIEGQANQDLPFEMLVDLLDVEKDPSRHPIFQVMFSVQDFSSNKMSDCFEAYKGKVSYQTAKFDLELYLSEKEEKIVGEFTYAISLFKEETIQRLITHYKLILSQLVKETEGIIQNYNVLTSQEKKQILYEWNETDKIFSHNKTVTQLFEEQVKKTPDNVALILEGEELTYRILNERSNQLARYIRKQYQAKTKTTFQTDTLIALCLERSFEMIIAILAVLKAGGAYVPIDPTYPDERIIYLLDDTQSSLLLTQTGLKEKLNKLSKEADLITLDDEPYQAESTEKLESYSQENDLAYVIYTSGTTGQPKGVAIPHKGIVNRIAWMQEKYPLSIGDKVLHKTPYVFDVSVWELLWANWYGASIVIAKPEGHRESDYLLDLIQKEKITHLHFVPSMLEAFNYTLNKENHQTVQSVRHLFCSGEALTTNLSDKTYQAFQSQNLSIHNLYGPTEASIDVSYFDCKQDHEVYLGRPIQNIKLYVLDKTLNPVPQGVLGELYIAGVGLARGYLNRPVLTKERFIENPFATEEDKEKGYTRLYKTGDVVRWLSDGNIEYIGRNDFQVKISGFRIELTEIENTLSRYPGIKQVCVLVKNNHYLVAYYVADQAIEDKDLATYLSQILPSYMVPSSFIWMQSFPITVSGKLDRKALPDPEFEGDESQYIAPHTELEKELCSIWEAVLGIQQVGITDNFFRVGNSLLAIQIAIRIQNTFNVSFPVKSIFSHPTIEGQAELIEKNNPQFRKTNLNNQVIIKNLSHDHSPLSFAQERIWFLTKLDETDSNYHIPLTYRIKGHLDLDALNASFNKLIERHAVLRTNFIETQSGLFQVLSEFKPRNIKLEQCLESNVSEKINHIFLSQINLETDVLFDATLYVLNENDYVLSIIMHHIISDGWSIGIIEKELTAFYEAYHKGKLEIDMPTPKIQYTDYSVWQRNMKDSPEWQEQHAYWMTKLHNAPYLNLPRIASEDLDSTAASFNFILPSEVLERLKKISAHAHTSLYTVLLSIFYLLLNKYSNTEDIVVGTLTANRHLQEIEPLIGVFINNLALRCKVDSTLTFDSHLQQVRECCLEAFQNQNIPFEHILEGLPLERDLYSTPIFQTMFILQNASDGQLLKFGSTDISRVGQDSVNANFDLTLEMYEGNESFFGSFIYRENMFRSEIIEQMAEHFIQLAESISNNSSLPLFEYTCETKLEKEIIKTLTGEVRPIKENETFLTSFDKVVKQYSNATAVIDGNVRLTYKELDDAAIKLAMILIELNQKNPVSYVPLLVDRGFNYLICLIGVMKAGLAFVPISAKNPVARNNEILKDLENYILLIEEKNEAYAKDLDKSFVLCIDKILENSNEHRISLKYPTQNDLAYIIFTSGSTGKPKGVMIEHLGMLNHLNSKVSVLNLSNKDVIAQTSSQLFDISIWQYLVALLKGGCVTIYKDEQAWDPTLLVNALLQDRVSVLELVPSQLLTLIEYLEIESMPLPSLKYLMITGEAFPVAYCKKWVAQYPHIPVINAYGPSECSDDVTHYLIKLESDFWWKYAPISGVVQNFQLYLLNNDLTQTPLGCVGELYVSGIGVGRGYLNNIHKTDEQFLKNPYADGQHSKLYKTGDLAILHNSGEIEFLGRKDFQIKVRGYRIEIGEIESVISSCEGINSAIVTLTQHGDRKFLTAYYVSEKEKDLDWIEEKIIQAMKNNLPEYMIPERLIRLEKLPLTDNGKVDIKQLQQINLSEVQTQKKPNSILEVKILTIWKDILSSQSVGMDEDFFAIGGYSLLTVRLISAIQKNLKIKLPLSWAFKHKTVKEQALSLEKSALEYDPVITLNKGSKEIPFVFVHPGIAGAEAYHNLVKLMDSSYTIYGIEYYNLQNPENMINNIEALASQYIKYLLALDLPKTINLLGFSLGGLLSYEIAIQLKREHNISVNHVFMLDSFILNQEDIEIRNKLYHEINDKFLNEAFDKDYVSLISKVSDNELLLTGNYSPSAYEGNVTMFKCKKTVDTHPYWQRIIEKTDNGFGEYAQSMKLIDLPCHHFEILSHSILTKIVHYINLSSEN